MWYDYENDTDLQNNKALSIRVCDILESNNL